MLAFCFRNVGDFVNVFNHHHPESVTYISNLSPTHLVSNIRHQHRRRLNLHVGDKICWGQLQNIGDRFDFCCHNHSGQLVVCDIQYVTHISMLQILLSDGSKFCHQFMEMEQKNLMQQRFFDDHNNLTFENFESR